LIQVTGITDRGVGVSYVTQTANQGSDSFDLEPIVLSPVMIGAARKIYQAYVDTHGSRQTPVGVAIDRYTFRGQVIFTGQPILLPHECFVTMRDIDMLDIHASDDS
jgi:hypothetical protein